ncbi:MAG TPA: hypothetical protein GXX51_00265 [Firmicutes bacterium]|nr:hypothetical protein [Bacillota bacterium]
MSYNIKAGTNKFYDSKVGPHTGSKAGSKACDYRKQNTIPGITDITDITDSTDITVITAITGITGIAEVIAAQSPDVVALQEVDRGRLRSGGIDQVRWLGDRLGYRYAYAPAFATSEDDGTKGEYGNALLSRFPLLSWEVIPLWHRNHLLPGEPGWVIEPRCCFVGRLLTPRTNPHSRIRMGSSSSVTVVGLHLSTTVDQRARQLEQVADLVTECGDTPLVLMGDFNAGHEELRRSRLSGLLDNIFACNPVSTFPSGAAARAAIDHIYVSSHWLVKAVWVVSERLDRSDHNPVVADLEL